MPQHPHRHEVFGFTEAHRAAVMRFVPIELARRIADPAALTAVEQHTLMQHLGRVLAALEVGVPRWVRDMLDNPRAAPTQRRDATLLFADVTGFTPLTAQLETFGRSGNEYLTLVLNQLFEAIVGVALAHGGDLLAFGGDAVLVAFSNADHVVAAAHAAQAMQTVIAGVSLAALVPLANLPPLQMKIGIASGPLLLTSVGTAERQVALALGGVLDATDAMANATAPGGIRLDSVAVTRAAHALDLVPQPDGSALLRGTHASSVPPWTPTDTLAVPIDTLLARLHALAAYQPLGVLATLVGTPNARPGDGEQRHVISLFAHLTGLHALADVCGATDLDRVAQVATASIGRILAIIEHMGGTLARVDTYPRGHKLLALFGAPTAHEHDAQRAVHAALTLRDAVQQADTDLAAQWNRADHHTRSGGSATRPNVPRIQVRAGINAGQVVAGLVGSTIRYEYTVMGDSVNVAARLMGKANLDAAEVLIGRGVYEALTEQLDAEARVLALKGKQAPLPAWAVRALRIAPTAQRGHTSPLVGRTAELRMVQQVADALHDGAGQVIVLQGEAGIGKTRLLRSLIAALGSTVLCLHSGSSGLAPPSFTLFRAPLRALCGIGPQMSPADARERVRQTLNDLLPEQHIALLSAFSVLLGLPVEAAVHVGDTSATQQGVLAHAVSTVLGAVAQQQPLAWVCEDLHAADAASLELLGELLQRDDLPTMLFCATTRPVRDGAAMASPSSVRVVDVVQRHRAGAVVQLGSLDAAAQTMLLHALLPGLASVTVSHICEHAGGNPLFLELLAQTVQQRGALQPSAAGLVLRATLRDLAVPATLRELVTAQLDRLPAEVRRVARAAAVIAVVDRMIDAKLLRDVADDSNTVAPRLRELQDAHMIEQINGTGTYTFRHALFQQSAYDGLQERERRRLHHRVGRAIHAQPDDLARGAALAFHSYEGQDWVLAAPATLAAGIRARQVYANRDARRELRRALGLARRLHLLDYEAAAREELGALYALLGRYAPARAHLLRARNHSAATSCAHETTARRHRLLALVDERTGGYTDAEAHCTTGLALLAAAPLPNLEVARLHAQRADVLLRRGDFAGAEAACRAGLAALPPEPDALRERVTLLQRLGMLQGERGRYTEAIRALEHSLPLARQLGDAALLAQLRNNLGKSLSLSGRNDEALAQYKESLQLSEQSGNITVQIWTMLNLGPVYLSQGDQAAALNCYTNAYELSQQFDRPDSRALAVLNIGCIQYEQGRLDEAHAYLLQASSIYKTLGDTSHLVNCLYVLGDIALAQHSPGAAQSYGEQAFAFAQQVGSIVFQSCAQRVRGEALRAQGQLDAARSALDEAERLQAEVGDPYDQARLLAAQAQLALAQSDRAAMVAYAASALALAREQHIGFLVTAMETLLAEARD